MLALLRRSAHDALHRPGLCRITIIVYAICWVWLSCAPAVTFAHCVS